MRYEDRNIHWFLTTDHSPCCDVSSLWEYPFWMVPFLMTEYFNKEVKLFLYLSLAPWILWGTGGIAPCILNHGHNWVELPSFLLGRFNSPGDRVHGTSCKGSWVGPGVVLVAVLCSVHKFDWKNGWNVVRNMVYENGTRLINSLVLSSLKSSNRFYWCNEWLERGTERMRCEVPTN